jgi:hypothetical protein
MRSVVVALLALLVASIGAGQALAQVWLTIADADGHFRLEIPVPFDMPLHVAPDGTATFSYVHETPELALRFEVIDGVDEAGPALATVFSRATDGEHIVQMHSHVVGRRTYRVVAIFPPEREGDATILRFLQSVRYFDDRD